MIPLDIMFGGQILPELSHNMMSKVSYNKKCYYVKKPPWGGGDGVYH